MSFFQPALADSLIMKFDKQQISSSHLNSSKYSGQSLTVPIVLNLSPISYFFISFLKPLGTVPNAPTTTIYITVTHTFCSCFLFLRQNSSILKTVFTFFYFPSVVYWNSSIYKITCFLFNSLLGTIYQPLRSGRI